MRVSPNFFVIVFSVVSGIFIEIVSIICEKNVSQNSIKRGPLFDLKCCARTYKYTYGRMNFFSETQFYGSKRGVFFGTLMYITFSMPRVWKRMKSIIYTSC